MLTVVILLCILFCLGVSLDGGAPLRGPDDLELYGADGQPLTGPNPNPGHLNLAFGAVRLPLFRDGAAAVHFLQVVLGSVVSGGIGLLFLLVWTAGFLPEFLRPGTATVLLVKPVPRWLLLLGKVLGVIAYVAVAAAVFFASTWLALGLRTGVWRAGYLLGAPLLVLHFASVYSFTVLLAVSTRSTAACVLGSILFWLVCLGVNYGRHATGSLPEAAAAAPAARAVVEVGYWLLPKPLDAMLSLEAALGAGEHLSTLPEFTTLAAQPAWMWLLAMLSPFAFAATVLVAAALQLNQTDY